MLTKEQAVAATNPADSDEVREASALKLMLGSLANDVYWASRGELEQLWAKVNGHGIVTRGVEDAASLISAGEQNQSDAIEAAATDVTPKQVTAGTTAAADEAPASEPTGSAEVADTAEAAAKLRAQLVAAGITPEA